jgi:hypothetical protein
MKGGTVKSNKGKSSFRGPNQGHSFGAQKGNSRGSWQGMGKKSILTKLNNVEKNDDSSNEEK